MLPKVFTGGHPFSELTTPIITSKIINGGRPARPQEAQGLGLTNSVWEMTVRCWHQDPVQRPTMTEVVRLACEWPVSLLSPWNEHYDILPAATAWMLCGPESRISRSRSSLTTSYPSVKSMMWFPLVVLTSSSPSSWLTKYSGNGSWRSITISQDQRRAEPVAGSSCAGYSEILEFSSGGM